MQSSVEAAQCFRQVSTQINVKRTFVSASTNVTVFLFEKISNDLCDL